MEFDFTEINTAVKKYLNEIGFKQAIYLKISR